MKIYFAGSIRGGREDALLYAEIIGFLQNWGTVLTEHIGDASLTISGDEGISDRDIHDRDLTWLHEAELIVAEVTIPSLGVGYELGRAVELGKRIICLHRPQPGKKLSAMIGGCEGIIIITYTNLEELKKALGELISMPN